MVGCDEGVELGVNGHDEEGSEDEGREVGTSGDDEDGTDDGEHVGKPLGWRDGCMKTLLMP